MEKNTIYMLSIVAMVAVVAVIVLTMKQGVVINGGSSGDLSGQAIIRTASQNMFRSTQGQSPQATAMSTQQMHLQVLIQSCMNKNSLPTYALCRQWALQQLGMDSGNRNENQAAGNSCQPGESSQARSSAASYSCGANGECMCTEMVTLVCSGGRFEVGGSYTQQNCPS